MSYLSGSLKGFKAGGSISFDDASATGGGFRTGGHVKKTGRQLIHRNEYVLPVGVKPTLEQKKAVRAIKAKANKK
jgi:hypothetical protein